MSDAQFWTIERGAALGLLLGVAVVFPGLIMFWVRGGVEGKPLPSQAYFVRERSFIMAAVLITAVALELLASVLEPTAGRVLARAGASAYLFVGVLLVAAEALSLSGGWEKHYPLIAIYVVAAFLAQAAIGVALLQSGLLPAWIGWVSIVWNLAWLVALPLLSPRDIYFPVLHHVVPLVIGIALLWQRG